MDTVKTSHALLTILIAAIITAVATIKFVQAYFIANTCTFQMGKALCYHKPTDMLYVIDPKGAPTRIAPRQ